MSLLPLIQGGVSSGSAFDTTTVGNSIWFDGSSDRIDSGSLSAQSDATCYTVAFWIQLNKFGTEQYLWSQEGGNYSSFKIKSTGELCFYTEGISEVKTSTKLKDVGWYHVAFSPKGGGTCNIFINGIQQSTTQSGGSGIPTNIISASNNHTDRYAGYFVGATGGSLIPYQGSMAQIVYLDGFSFQDGDVTAASFLDTVSDRFVPKANSELATLAGTAGAESYCLDFSNSSDLGNDISSKNNDFTLTSMTSANHSTNSPSNVYPNMNILDPCNSTRTFSEGNMKVTGSGGSDGGAIATLPLPTNGTTEFQVKCLNGQGRVGIMAKEEAQKVSVAADNACGGGVVDYSAGYHYTENGTLRTILSSGESTTTPFTSFTTNDVITVRYNADDNELNFLKNNVAQGSTISTVSGLLYWPVVTRFNDYNFEMFFDKDDFPHTIGTGNQELNSATLSTTSFSNPQAFTVKGTGSTNGPNVYFGFTLSTSDAMTINSNAVTYGTDVQVQGSGVKLISTSSNFNTTGTNTISVVTANALEINGSKPPPYGQTN